MKFIQPKPTHLCANPECSHREWQVEADGETRGLWHLRGKKGTFTMASSTVACPVCNDQLLEITSLEPMLEQVFSAGNSVQTN